MKTLGGVTLATFTPCCPGLTLQERPTRAVVIEYTDPAIPPEVVYLCAGHQDAQIVVE